jgi:putative transposase
VVDTQGFLLNVAITAANAHDSHGLKALFDPFPPGLARLRGVLADGAYQGFRTWLWLFATVWLTVVKRPDVKGFVVIPKRWVVERTFAWLGRSRRLSKDYEFLPASSRAFIFITMSALMLRRLSKS